MIAWQRRISLWLIAFVVAVRLYSIIANLTPDQSVWAFATTGAWFGLFILMVLFCRNIREKRSKISLTADYEDYGLLPLVLISWSWIIRGCMFSGDPCHLHDRSNRPFSFQCQFLTGESFHIRFFPDQPVDFLEPACGCTDVDCFPFEKTTDVENEFPAFVPGGCQTLYSGYVPVRSRCPCICVFVGWRNHDPGRLFRSCPAGRKQW